MSDQSRSTSNSSWWTLVAVCVATFMLLLDVTIVNVALPKIQTSLHASFSDLQWVVDAYALTLAAFLLTAGSLADLFGRRLVFLVGIGIFTVASLSSGLSESPTVLNVSRAVQGVGGAAMFATALALIAQEYEGSRRGTAFGIWGATTGAAVAVGPLAGGALTDGFGWESIFFINIPVGIGAIVLTLLRVHESRQRGARRRIDWGGFATFSAGLACLIFALIRGNAEGWTSTQILGLLALGVALLVAFVAVELRSEQPMLDLSLFRNPTFAAASIVAFALSGSIFAMFLYFTIYLQDILGYEPLATGLRFLPLSVLSFFAAAMAGKLTERYSPRWFLGGGLLVVGAALLSMHGLDASSTWTALLPGLIAAGIGVGLVNPPLASTAVAVVAPQNSGMASGINSTFRQVGIATGIAGLGAIFQHVVLSHSLENLRQISSVGAAKAHELAAAVTSGGGAKQAFSSVPPQARQQVGVALRSGFTDGMNEILLVAAALAIAGGALALVLIRASDFAPGPAGEQQHEPEPAAAV
ncbi:MAG TPA: MFS transporter [Solirubrobacteraceae bacterium]|nr:MFS transporter [Solirubrobacteraceae bacterium]